MLAGNTTEVSHYYKKLTSHLFPLKISPDQSLYGFLQTRSGQPECLSSEGVGRKLLFHPASLVKKSFPFHIQTEPRLHWGKDIPCSLFFSKCKSKISPSIWVTPLEHQPFVFQPLLYLIPSNFPVGLLPHALSPSWITWLPGSWLLLCDPSGLARHLNLEMWNSSWQNLVEIRTIPPKVSVSINWYFPRIKTLPAHRSINQIWLLAKVKWFQWTLHQVWSITTDP